MRAFRMQQIKHSGRDYPHSMAGWRTLCRGTHFNGSGAEIDSEVKDSMDDRKLYLKYSKAEDLTIRIRGYGGDNLISPDGFPASGGLGGSRERKR